MKTIKYFLFTLFVLSLNLKAQYFYPTERIDQHVRLVAKKNIPENQMYWKINQIKQDPPRSWCQTTCTSMLLSFMGVFHINAMDIEWATTGGRKPPAMSQIVSLLNKYRISFFAARLEPAKSRPELVLEYAKDVCDKGSPPYILLNRHAYVIAGYNNKRKEVYMIDPNRDKEILLYTYDNFNKWVANSQDYKDVKKVFLAHKITQPKRFFYVVESNAVSRLVLLK
jgi:hypothetical protein